MFGKQEGETKAMSEQPRRRRRRGMEGREQNQNRKQRQCTKIRVFVDDVARHTTQGEGEKQSQSDEEKVQPPTRGIQNNT